MNPTHEETVTYNNLRQSLVYHLNVDRPAGITGPITPTMLDTILNYLWTTITFYTATGRTVQTPLGQFVKQGRAERTYTLPGGKTVTRAGRKKLRLIPKPTTPHLQE